MRGIAAVATIAMVGVAIATFCSQQKRVRDATTVKIPIATSRCSLREAKSQGKHLDAARLVSEQALKALNPACNAEEPREENAEELETGNLSRGNNHIHERTN